MKYSLKQRNFWFVLLADAVLVSLAYYFAYLLRFDGAIPPKYFARWSQTVIWIAPLIITLASTEGCGGIRALMIS
jgi:hypothetical protein